MDAVETSGDSGGVLSFNRDLNKRQQGMLRFSTHMALGLAALGLVPWQYDMGAGISFRDAQASTAVLKHIHLMCQSAHCSLPGLPLGPSTAQYRH